MEYKFITLAGMDYDIDPEDNDPDTLLALNNFTINEEDLKDDNALKEILLHNLVVLGLERFMNIAEYKFKDTSTFALAEKFKEVDEIETDMVEYIQREFLVGKDLDSAERKRAYIPEFTKIRLTFTKTPITGGYKLNVYQWTNDNDEDGKYKWSPLFWITTLVV